MRVAIVEDDLRFLETLKLLLADDSEITVVGAYRSAEDAIPSLKEASPDVLLTDLGLPGMSGIDFIKKVKEAMPRVEILAHTFFVNREMLLAAVQAGASGYILKGSETKEITHAIHILRNGGSVMSPAIAQKVISEFQDGCGGSSNPRLLSTREQALVAHIAEGLTYGETARQLGINPKTVYADIKLVYQKLREKSTAAEPPA